MTKTTEELKREMYSKLAAFKRYAVTLDTLEQSIEAYLEGLRQDMQCASIEQDDLSIRLANMTTERDTLRNKLQAFEFANRSAAELLSEALREPSGLRKTSQAIPQQESSDHASCAACRAYDRLDYPSNVVPIFKLIRENTEYTLTPEQFEAFEQMLQSKPASENKALQDLLNRKPGWNDGDQS